MRDASLERTSYGSLLDSPEFGALRDRGTTRRPTIPRQGSGRRVSSRLSVTRTVTAEGHPSFGSKILGSRIPGLSRASGPGRRFRPSLPRRCRNSSGHRRSCVQTPRRTRVARSGKRAPVPLGFTAASVTFFPFTKTTFPPRNRTSHKAPVDGRSESSTNIRTAAIIPPMISVSLPGGAWTETCFRTRPLRWRGRSPPHPATQEGKADRALSDEQGAPDKRDDRDENSERDRGPGVVDAVGTTPREDGMPSTRTSPPFPST